MDLLTSALRLWQSTRIIDREVYLTMCKMIDLTKSRKTYFSMLIKDPFSIEIELPIQSENKVRRDLRSGLHDIVKNPALSNLFAKDSNIQETDLITDLVNLNPKNPIVMHYTDSEGPTAPLILPL